MAIVNLNLVNYGRQAMTKVVGTNRLISTDFSLYFFHSVKASYAKEKL